MHQDLMQKSPLIDDGCTVLDDPYVLLEAEASK